MVRMPAGRATRTAQVHMTGTGMRYNGWLIGTAAPGAGGELRDMRLMCVMGSLPVRGLQLALLRVASGSRCSHGDVRDGGQAQATTSFTGATKPRVLAPAA